MLVKGLSTKLSLYNFFKFVYYGYYGHFFNSVPLIFGKGFFLSKWVNFDKISLTSGIVLDSEISISDARKSSVSIIESVFAIALMIYLVRTLNKLRDTLK
jgi:hypothetical protein